jgi:hypothetical protein
MDNVMRPRLWGGGDGFSLWASAEIGAENE